MSKPKVTLENYSAVYDYYQDKNLPQRLAKIGYGAMALAYKPIVEFEAGAEAEIGELLRSDVRLILASNHVSDHDQYIVASMAHRTSCLRELRGNTFIPSKASLFKNPILRTGVDILGGVPTFRVKDVAGKDDEGTVSEAAISMQKAAGQRVQDVSAYKIIAGLNMAIFPEGTRNKAFPREVQPLKIGLGNIACQVAEKVDVAILPIGMYFGEGREANYRRPSVLVGRPMSVEMIIDPKQVINEFAPRLQACVDAAVDFRQ